MEIFCFFIGILYTYTHIAYLPLSAALIFYLTPRYQIFLLFFLGIGVAWLHQWYVSPKGTPNVPVLSHALLQGTIASIPMQSLNKTQFVFSLEKINQQPAKGLIQLAWYNKTPPLHAGQRWLLTAKIKKPRNFLNPGSSDYVRALSTRHIVWTGYISSQSNQLLTDASSISSWLILRERLKNRITQLAPTQQIAGIISALTLNLTNQIGQEDWNLFRRTGTTHLFGISGEHIALISGLIILIVKWLWSRSKHCCLYIPALSIASSCGFLIALLYAFLAGFAPPVQRALVGCFFYTLYATGKQRFTPWQTWRYALFTVLFLEPHAVFMQGFYFSFLAVVCLLLTQQRWRLTGYQSKLALQLSCLVGLMPLTLYWFAYGSINGFIANLFAIPLVGLLIVPLALVTLLCSSFSWCWVLIKALSWLIILLFKGLSWTELFANINITYAIQSEFFVLALMMTLLLWILLPIKPFKYLALLYLIIPFFPAKKLIQPNEALIQVLDVGQGLAVSIRTRHHSLLYDTGDQFFLGSDLGTLVILPFYQSLGLKKLDKIVISHPDKDHRGGLKSIQTGMQVTELLVNEPRYYHQQGINCHNYPPWEWDGITFRFLPIRKKFPDKNNNSCILQIGNASGRVLLTGDIEQMAEDYLVTTYDKQLASNILIIPHHGSKTSSSYRFLLEVSPQYAIASLGFDNRFRFPHTKTLTSLHNLHIPFIRTDECGMTEIHLPAHGKIQKPLCYRQ